MAIVSMTANRRRRHGAQSSAAGQHRILIHAINDDRCTGCDACVAVCPTNVLDLISNKSRVLRFQDCIQCEACMWACPTEALVMFPEGTTPPPVRVPNIDGSYQTAVPGQYLIGEVAGKPLVKNAANLGRAVVEHMLQSGLQPTPGTADSVDVLIVGSGPGGMSAALTCRQRGLSYLVIEKENVISSTVSRYPKGKLVMAEPYETENLSFLPIFDSTKEEMVRLWKELAALVELNIKMHETVQIVQRQHDGSFLTATTAAQYRSQRVVLATGTRGKPRTLGVPGEHFPKVESLLEDPDDHTGKAVCVVGGGDSALEAALALAHAGAKVIVSYRGRSFHRAQAKNRQQMDKMASEGRIKIKLQSEVVEFGEETITLQMSDGTQKRYPNEAAFVLIGADPPIQWLSSLGIHYVERPHMQPMAESDKLIRQIASTAQVCPPTAEDAAALIFGKKVSPVPARPHTKEKAGVGRRFVRSASSLFGLGEEAKRPIPLSEFVSRGQTEKPRRRDQLDAGERTRILRMLRDEGGRQADEDSQVYKVDQIISDDELEVQPASSRRPAPLATLPPPSQGEAGAPRQAVIVGLAKAAAGAPQRRRHVAPAVHEESTQHLSEDEARMLLSRSTPQPVIEEATSLIDFDPAKMMREKESSGPADFGHDTEQEEDKTRNVDLSSFLENGTTPPPTVEDQRALTPMPEERTRVVDDGYEPRSLSEVEWDLD